MTDFSPRSVEAVSNLLVVLSSEAMLLRHPHTGIAEAARQAEAIIGAQVVRITELEAALSTARNDALRKAAGACREMGAEYSLRVRESMTPEDIAQHILALIQKEPTQ